MSDGYWKDLIAAEGVPSALQLVYDRLDPAWVGDDGHPRETRALVAEILSSLSQKRGPEGEPQSRPFGSAGEAEA